MKNLILLFVLLLTISTASAGTYIATGVQHTGNQQLHTEGFFTATRAGTVTLNIRNSDGDVVVGGVTYDLAPFQTVHWDTREWDVLIEDGSITIHVANANTFVLGDAVVKIWDFFTIYTSEFTVLFALTQ